MNNSLKYTVFLLLFLIHTSCMFEKSKTASIEYEGKYVHLANDRIKLFLPNSFEIFSSEQYEDIINSIEDSLAKDRSLKKFNALKWSKGNIYYILDTINGVEINVKIEDYFPFSKTESSYISAMLLQACKETSTFYNADCKRITSGYSGNQRTKLFKGVYEVTIDEKTRYNNIYLITSNYKTFIVQIFSPFDIDFDPFIQKTIVQ